MYAPTRNFNMNMNDLNMDREVADFITKGKTWDIDWLLHSFAGDLSANIFSIPIPQGDWQDHLVWACILSTYECVLQRYASVNSIHSLASTAGKF